MGSLLVEHPSSPLKDYRLSCAGRGQACVAVIAAVVVVSSAQIIQGHGRGLSIRMHIPGCVLFLW